MKKVEGIILKRSPRFEADAIFEVYTKELGLVHFQAKSVRKYTGKLKSGLEVFNWAEIYFVPAKYLPIITETKVKNYLPGIKNNLYRLKLAQVAAYVLPKIMEPGLTEPEIWHEVSIYFSNLNDETLDRAQLLKKVYFLCYRLMILNGYQPQLEKCTKCHQSVLGENLKLSLTSGGLVHLNCLVDLSVPNYREANNVLNLNKAVLAFVNQISSPEFHFKADDAASLAAGHQPDFERLVRLFFGYHFGIDLSKLL